MRDLISQSMAAITSRLGEAYPATNRGVVPLLKPYTEEFVGRDVAGMLYTMLAAVFGVLLGFAMFWPRERIYLWMILPVEAWLLAVLLVVGSLYMGVSGSASRTASSVAQNAIVCTQSARRSMSCPARSGTSAATSRSSTVPPILERQCVVSNRRMGRTPLSPRQRAANIAGAWWPSGLTTPSPVTTTRRRPNRITTAPPAPARCRAGRPRRGRRGA